MDKNNLKELAMLEGFWKSKDVDVTYYTFFERHAGIDKLVVCYNGEEIR